MDLTKLIEKPVNRVLSELMQLQDASQEVELKQARSKTLMVLEEQIDLAISGSLKTKVKSSFSHSHLHFRGTGTLEELGTGRPIPQNFRGRLVATSGEKRLHQPLQKCYFGCNAEMLHFNRSL